MINIRPSLIKDSGVKTSKFVDNDIHNVKMADTSSISSVSFKNSSKGNSKGQDWNNRVSEGENANPNILASKGAPVSSQRASIKDNYTFSEKSDSNAKMSEGMSDQVLPAEM